MDDKFQYPSARPAPPTGGTGTAWACAGLLALAVTLAWWDSLAVPFLYDDLPAIVENTTIRQWDTALAPPNSGVASAGRPLVNLSFALNHALAGKKHEAVIGFHLFNLAIHLAAALALFGLVRRTLRSRVDQPDAPPAPSAATGAHPLPAGIGAPRLPTEPILTWTALAAALLWALHPLQTGTVTYISERTESMCALFYLLTLYCFARSAGSARPWRWLGLAILADFAGMACKEVMVTAPLMVLLYDRTFVAGSFGAALRRRRVFYAGLAASWLLLGWLVQGAGNGRMGRFAEAPEITPWTYLLKQCEAIVGYLRLSLWPRHLVFDRGFAVVGDPSLAWWQGAMLVWWQGSLLLILFGATLWALWRRPALGFLGIWFFALLAPSSSVVPIATETMAEHRMYLPLAALAVAAVLAGHALARARSLAVWALVAGALGIATSARNLDYRSPVAIWAGVVAQEPGNARGHEEYALALDEAGQWQASLAEHRAALKLIPTYPVAHQNYAAAMADAGMTAEAMAEYRRAVQLNPGFAEAWYGIGNMERRMGRNEDAVAAFQQALQLRNDRPAFHVNLALALTDLGRFAEAESHYREAIRLAPDWAEAHYNYASLFVRQNRPADAVVQLRQTVELDPAFFDAQVNLGMGLFMTGHQAEGIKALEAALRLKPGDADTQARLAAMKKGLKD